jgi:hypothetical protein
MAARLLIGDAEARGIKITTAESCTGGLVAALTRLLETEISWRLILILLIILIKIILINTHYQHQHQHSIIIHEFHTFIAKWI